jgi:hypothetical protein
MARTLAVLTAGSRVSDYISLGVIAKCFPAAKVEAILAETGRTSQRHRELPSHVVVYYVVALALYMQVSYGEVLRCLLEGIQWLLGPHVPVKVTGKSGISQARTRLGSEPVKRLYDEIVVPIATADTLGAWYRDWRMVSLDGSTLAVTDTRENDEAFGRPMSGYGAGGVPLLRFVSLVENGTHVLFGARMAPFEVGEITLAHEVIERLEPGMLCLADRYFAGYHLLRRAIERGSDILWRVRVNAKLPNEKRLADGSYISYMDEPEHRGSRKAKRIPVRVIEYRLEGIKEAEPIYRLITTILEPERTPAQELAALYQERWEIETALDELKTHLRGAGIVLRSKTPELVRQEFFGLMMAHFAVRSLMHEAALKEGIDADRLSFVHAVRVIRRKLPQFVAFPPSEEGSMA